MYCIYSGCNVNGELNGGAPVHVVCACRSSEDLACVTVKCVML